MKNLRYVIKVGTNSLEIKNSFKEITKYLHKFYLRGGRPILVSSGAVAKGMDINKLKERPKDIKELQDLSAEGTRVLANTWAKEFAKYNIGIWYIQPTWQNFSRKKDFNNIRTRIHRAELKRKITIWNLNDALNNEELAMHKNGFHDNDPLAVKLAIASGASRIIFITDKGNMGSGGGSSKSKSIKRALKSGIVVKVGQLKDLKDML